MANYRHIFLKIYKAATNNDKPQYNMFSETTEAMEHSIFISVHMSTSINFND